ncbi:MAG: hypothetical protein RIM23_04585 [Coleofasciculus sp. G3-WIS-01]|uniref:hypothetical protein n=1 Tax=Coleofasciculus sp. G3-WIS-01 TaxID=3069528 RepID=UPI0032FB6CBF
MSFVVPLLVGIMVSFVVPLLVGRAGFVVPLLVGRAGFVVPLSVVAEFSPSSRPYNCA